MIYEAEKSCAAWITERRLSGGSLVGLPAALKPASEAAGYRIQEDLRARLTDAGYGEIVGWKIGVTTPQMRAHLGLEAPIAAVMHARGRRAPGVTLRTQDFCRLGIECEVAMVLGAPLGGGATVSSEDAVRAVAAIHPAIELVDDRYGGDYLGIGVPAIIADFAFHAGFLLGAAVPEWRRIDLGAVKGVTRANGAVRCEGFGRDVQGHPMLSLAWLANRVTALGQRLEPGQIVMTGSLPVPYWAKAGDAIEIEIEKLGRVGLTLT
jgi:2-keto-4-pentenoate hydratase